MGLTADLLKKAILGESNAARKYTKFAEIAVQEGFKNIGYLFRALVIAEHIHIKNHRKALGEKYEPNEENSTSGKTIENVNAAINGENWEYKTMYAGFIKEIKKNDKSEYGEVAELSMNWARGVELNHAKILQLALTALQAGHDLDIDELYVCKVCGNLVIGKPTDVCEICGHDELFFIIVKRD